MSADGKTIAVSAPSNAFGQESTFVGIYSFDSLSSNWTQIGLDINGSLFDGFGRSLVMSADGKTIAVGAPRIAIANGTVYGGVRVYAFNSGSNNWEQVGLDIIGEGENGESGYSLAMSEDGKTIAIGAPYNNLANDDFFFGHVRVYSFYSISGNWEQVGSDIDGKGESFDFFGSSLGMSADGNTIAVGAPSIDSSRGEVYVYSFNNSRLTWEQVGVSINGDNPNDSLGQSVAISADGKTIAITAIGVKVFSFNSILGNWMQVGSDIIGDLRDGNFGWSVSMSADGSTIAVGAFGSGTTGLYSFNSVLGNWVQIGVDIDVAAVGDNALSNAYGFSVSISADGTTVAIGAPFNNFGNGNVRVYKFEPIMV
jgi:FG-GAP repeat